MKTPFTAPALLRGVLLALAFLGLVSQPVLAKGKKSSPDFQEMAGKYSGNLMITGSFFGDPIASPGTGQVQIKSGGKGKSATLVINAVYTSADGGQVVINGSASLKGGAGAVTLHRERLDGLDFITGTATLPVTYSGKGPKVSGNGVVPYVGSALSVTGKAQVKKGGKITMVGSLASDFTQFTFTFTGKKKGGK